MNIAQLHSNRCSVTRLTKLQVRALANACIEMPEDMPNGVYRSLVIRGLLTSTHALTADGREASASCTVLSEQFRRSLLAIPVVATVSESGGMSPMRMWAAKSSVIKAA